MVEINPTSLRRIDCHVHIVGNGSNGSGCWIRPRGIHQFLYRFMLKDIGLPQSALYGNLESFYEARLLNLIQTSSLNAAVILAMDEVYDESGKKMEGKSVFYVPNDYVLNLAQKHPEFLAGISIHPARPDALDELERCIEQGAALLKILPNVHNIDCNDRRFKKMWLRMVEAGLPLLAHTGSEHTLPVIRPEFATPEILRFPLECGVTVIAGHSAAKNWPFEPNYFEVLINMMEKYPNLYGDTSAFNLPIRCRYFKRCLEMESRFIHGSDFPVPIMPYWAWINGLIDFKQMRKISREPNPLERDIQIKQIVGFPEEHFTRFSLFRRSALRINKELPVKANTDF